MNFVYAGNARFMISAISFPLVDRCVYMLLAAVAKSVPDRLAALFRAKRCCRIVAVAHLVIDVAVG